MSTDGSAITVTGSGDFDGEGEFKVLLFDKNTLEVGVMFMDGLL